MNPFKFAGNSKTSHTHFRKLAIQARLMEGAGKSSCLFALEPNVTRDMKSNITPHLKRAINNASEQERRGFSW